MASLVGVYAASHGPMIAREWDSLTPPTRASVEQGFGQVGKRLMASRPDVLVDGLSLYNRALSMDRYPELRAWLGGYREVARTQGSVIYVARAKIGR